MSAVQYISCDNEGCDNTKEYDLIRAPLKEGDPWYSLWSNKEELDLCSYKCLVEKVEKMGGRK